MAVALREIESRASDNQLFRNFLKDSTAEQMCEFVSYLEESGNLSLDFILDMKTLAFMKFETVLAFRRYYFKANNSKRYRTELYIEPSDNAVVLFISVKDSRDEDKMRARLFDAYKDQLINHGVKNGGLQ